MPPAKCENWIFSVGNSSSRPLLMSAHGRDHQRKFPAEHAAEIVGIHVLPVDDVRQRMDEDIEPEIGRRSPERAQRVRVERLALQLGGDDHAGKAEIDGAALHLGRGFGGLQRRARGARPMKRPG